MDPESIQINKAHNILTINKPKIVSKNINSIVLCWDDCVCVPSSEKQDNIVYTLQINRFLNGWETIYWGVSTKYEVHNLSSGVCYEFRLSAEYKQNETQVLQLDKNWSEVTRVNTLTCAPPISYLFRALRLNKIPVIKRIIKERPTMIDIADKEGKTPLLSCVLSNDLQMVQLVLNLGANVESPHFLTRRTALMNCILHGYLHIAKLLLEKGADVNYRDINSFTPLHYAVDTDNLECVDFILKNGGNTNMQDSKGWTPIMRAVILDCNIHIIYTLLKHNSDINLKDKNGFTCLDLSKLNKNDQLIELFSKPTKPN